MRFLQIHDIVRRFHVYRKSWVPKKNELLDCLYEKDNPFDRFVIKTIAASRKIVGHLPIEISRLTKFLLDRGTNVNAILLPTDYCHPPLVQRGLEIKCAIRVEKIGIAVNQQIMDKYLELVEENYSEPEDELILGSCENCNDEYLKTLQYLLNQIRGRKVEKASNNDRDIRTLLLNASANVIIH